MSNQDTNQVGTTDEDLQASCAAANVAESPEADEGVLNFKISVRKVQVKVQARGVLAE
jgi:hypothetical protein